MNLLTQARVSRPSRTGDGLNGSQKFDASTATTVMMSVRVYGNEAEAVCNRGDGVRIGDIVEIPYDGS